VLIAGSAFSGAEPQGVNPDPHGYRVPLQNTRFRGWRGVRQTRGMASAWCLGGAPEPSTHPVDPSTQLLTEVAQRHDCRSDCCSRQRVRMPILDGSQSGQGGRRDLNQRPGFPTGGCTRPPTHLPSYTDSAQTGGSRVNAEESREKREQRLEEDAEHPGLSIVKIPTRTPDGIAYRYQLVDAATKTVVAGNLTLDEIERVLKERESVAADL